MENTFGNADVDGLGHGFRLDRRRYERNQDGFLHGRFYGHAGQDGEHPKESSNRQRLEEGAREHGRPAAAALNRRRLQKPETRNSQLATPG
jgi:hypothetical protein